MKNKYNSKKVVMDGIKFDSKWEAQIYKLIKLNPALELIARQFKVYLTDAKILIKPDFLVKEKATGKIYCVEAKGMKTATYAIKERLWKKYGPFDLHVFTTKENYIVKGGKPVNLE